jgi:hypothetical protein
MSRRTPTIPSQALPAEEYELPTINDEPEAGPSRPRRTKPLAPVRRLTIHAGPSSSVLFSAHPSHSPNQRRTSNHGHGHGHHRNPSYPESPRASNFLDEDLDYFGGTQARRSEEVQMPNLGHMLGFNPDDEDHYAVAAGMGSVWKKRLYLLMEEPSSGREAFYVHIGVTGGIIFR